MIQQSVAGRPLRWWEGALLILALVAGLFVFAVLAELADRVGKFQYGGYAVWAVGIGAAYFVMRRFVRSFRYTLNEGTLYLERMLGASAKIVATVALVDVKELGPLRDMLEKHPDLRVRERVSCARAPLPEYGILYVKDGAPCLCAFQPDEKMRGEIDRRRGIRGTMEA